MVANNDRALATTAERGGEIAQRLKSLVMKNATPAQLQLAVIICQRYGFDPLLKHIVFINDNLYVTRDGLLDNAHRSEKLDGIEVKAEQDTSSGKWIATASVWRKDMGHAFTYTAYQAEHENAGNPAWKKAPRAMTVKCAEVMALRRAFNISLGSAEEMGFDEATVKSEPRPPVASIRTMPKPEITVEQPHPCDHETGPSLAPEDLQRPLEPGEYAPTEEETMAEIDEVNEFDRLMGMVEGMKKVGDVAPAWNAIKDSGIVGTARQQLEQAFKEKRAALSK